MEEMKGEAGKTTRGIWKCCRPNTEGAKLRWESFGCRHPDGMPRHHAVGVAASGGMGRTVHPHIERGHPHTPQPIPFLGSYHLARQEVSSLWMV